MPDTAFTFPQVGENRGTGTAWTNPGNITADDNNVAEVTITTAGGQSQYLVARQFGFNLQNANILGITVQVSCNQIAPPSGIAFPDELQLDARLRNNAGSLVGNTYTQSVSTFDELVYTFGGTADTWAAGLGLADVNSANFGVELRLTQQISYPFAIDWVKIRISYEVVNSASLNAISSQDSKATTRADVSNNSIASQDIKATYRASVFNSAISSNLVRNTYSTKIEALLLSSILALAILSTKTEVNAQSFVTSQPETRITVSNAGISSSEVKNTIRTDSRINGIASINAVQNIGSHVFGQAVSSVVANPVIRTVVEIDGDSRFSNVGTLSGDQILTSSSNVATSVSFSIDASLLGSSSVFALSFGEGASSITALSSVEISNAYSFECSINGGSTCDVRYTLSSSAVLDGAGACNFIPRTQGATATTALAYVEVPTQGTSIGLQSNASLQAGSTWDAKASLQSTAGLSSVTSLTATHHVGALVDVLAVSSTNNSVTLSSGGKLDSVSSGSVFNSYGTDARLDSSAFWFAQKSDEGFAFLLSVSSINVQPETSLIADLNSVSSQGVASLQSTANELAANSSVSATAFPRTDAPLNSISYLNVAYSASNQTELLAKSNLFAVPTVQSAVDISAIAYMEALPTGGVEVKYGIRSPRFGILGIPFGSFTNVTSDVDIASISSLDTNPIVTSEVVLLSTATIEATYEKEITITLTGLATIIAVHEPIYELCPCPEYEQEQTTVMTTEHGGDVVACTINRKGCD